MINNNSTKNNNIDNNNKNNKMDVLDNDFLVDKEYEEITRRCNQKFTEFWYNRIYSFRNLCIKMEEDRFRNLVEINKRIEKQCDYDYLYDDDYSTEEDYLSEVDYNYDYNEEESDSN